MKECDAVKTQNHGRGTGRRTGRAAVGPVLWAAPVVLLTAIIFVSPAQAQQPKETPVCSTGRELITIPEVTRKADGKLRAVLMLSDEYRSMGGAGAGEGRCLWQHLRYFKGWDAAADPPEKWPPPTSPPNPPDLKPGEPIPGPTLRARIGDLIQISFLNQIDTKNFPTSLDLGEKGKTPGCDEATGTATAKDPQDPTKTITIKTEIYPRNDTMPNCLHGSSTSNVHFHGTHTTPSTTGDNVLLYIRPALRVKGQIDPADGVVKSAFGKIFDSCEKNGSPTKWDQLPLGWRDEQKRLLTLYDATAPYKGIPGNLPFAMKLWPKNEKDIKEGQWPQISIGAFPYCFRVPDNEDYKEGKVKMAQAPGTHWYHAHKHGSTALNVGNGMTGAFIIEGPYDDQLRDFYKKTNPDPGLEEKVLVIQQLETSLNMLSAPAGTAAAPLSVNGRRQPVITMRPGQVQLWRIVNGAPRSFVQFVNFVPLGITQSPCSNTETPCVDWRQTAQDGVQFAPDNYEKVGEVNAKFNMAGANRVDLLVKAPGTTGQYTLQVVDSVLASPPGPSNATLLTVNVTGAKVEPSMDFIDKEHFPDFPEFLKDIPKGDVSKTRELVFDTTPGSGRSGGDPPHDLPRHSIDGRLFSNDVSQSMILNSVEEWTLVNKAVGIAHPFHIHINPFQAVEVFDPNSAEATNSKGPCYADPKDPTTWDPKTRKPSCTALEAPFVWWDDLAIPSARDAGLLNPAVECVQDKSAEGKYRCPNSRGNACTSQDGKQLCSVTIPGYFKMRSRFADFPGLFVQHCHILAHEDRGMMQLIEVHPKGSPRTTGEAIPTHF